MFTFTPLQKLCAVCLLLASLYSCRPARDMAETPAPPPGSFPSVEKEFRAAWVATVANINWPEKPGLPVEEQKRQAIALLDFLKDHHFNAVVFQVRPQCDALYPSELEPWSYYLTGEQGKAPSPFYDPLEFWVEAAHERGLELHVWLNPYRAHHKDGKEISEQSIIRKKPELVVYLKEGYWWMDPALKGTQDHSSAVVRDLVSRYDIDGVHFDDYFYPYPSYNLGEDFPDSASWDAYQRSGGKLSRGDWRREAVNTFIERVYREIKQLKPHVKFGLSPFGVWRPGYPESIRGFDQYNQLYADARLWLNKGWIDYFTPQLYWPINRIPTSFPVLLGWWSGENKMNRHLWPGISVGRDTSARNVNEILSQIMISRGMLPSSMGVVHWSISSLTRNPPMAAAILAGPYKRPALVPSSPWLDDKAPAAPSVNVARIDTTITINWTHPDPRDVFRWVVYFKPENEGWDYTILERGVNNYTLKRSGITGIRVSAVDRTGNESRHATGD